MALKKRAWRSEKGHGARKKGHGAAPCYFALDLTLASMTTLQFLGRFQMTSVRCLRCACMTTVGYLGGFCMTTE